MKAAIACILLSACVSSQTVIGACTASDPVQQPCPAGTPYLLATGIATPGGVVTFHANQFPGTIGANVSWIVIADGVIPMPGVQVPGVIGVLLLNPVTATIFTGGASPTFPGHVAQDVLIPNLPTMIGLELHAQAMSSLLPPFGFQLALSYAWGVTIT